MHTNNSFTDAFIRELRRKMDSSGGSLLHFVAREHFRSALEIILVLVPVIVHESLAVFVSPEGIHCTYDVSE